MSANKLVKVFYCCSDSVRDEEMRQTLENHLRGLARQCVITSWHGGMISPGKDWEAETNTQLKTADIILVLISSDFIASDYHWEVVIKQAMKQHRTKQSRVIPVLLRSVDDTWKFALDNLTALPEGEKPVTSWKPYDNGFANIAKGIKKVAEELTDPTYHLKKYSRQTVAFLIKIVKVAGNILIYFIRNLLDSLWKSSRYRRYRRVNISAIKLIILTTSFFVFLRLFFQQSDMLEIPSLTIPENFSSKPNYTPKLSQKVNSTGWIWLGMVRNSSGGVFGKKILINKPKKVAEYPSLTSIVVPSPGTIVTVRYKVNLRKEKSVSSKILNELKRGDKLVIIKVEPVEKPSKNATYIRLMAQVRKCDSFCNK